MIITVSPTETYTIEIPEKPKLDELKGLVSRLNKVLKFIDKDELGEQHAGEQTVKVISRKGSPMRKSVYKSMTKLQIAEFAKPYFEAKSHEERWDVMQKLGFQTKSQAYNFIDKVAGKKFGVNAKNYKELITNVSQE